ncbi:MAG: hypothetical protein AAF934_07025 [Bacteroidota bacterium]
MEQQKIILDSYLHGYQKFIVFYFLMIVIFGYLNVVSQAESISSYLLATLILGIIFFFVVFLVVKNGLCFVKGKLYRGITISNIVVIKESIDLTLYSTFRIKRRKKSNLPWFLEFSGFGLFANYHECSVYLIRTDGVKRKILISMEDYDLSAGVVNFLEKYTGLSLEQDHIN